MKLWGEIVKRRKIRLDNNKGGEREREERAENNIIRGKR